MTDAKLAKGRRQLILLALVFFGPLLVAIAMYFTGSTGGDRGQVNYGTLIQPPVSLDAKLHFDTGLRGRWTLAFKTDQPCADDCDKTLIDLRQIRLATGREIDRIERLLIAPTNSISAEMLERHPGLQVSGNMASTGAALGIALNELDAEKIYVIDPLGNVMMQYDVSPDRKKFLKDLKKLLKFSRIG
ncbi:MAG: hypothetical protein AB8F65_13535 [Woeseiaceae bacterium]